MSKLHRRIANVGTAHTSAQSEYHPYGTAETRMIMPLAEVTAGDGGVTYNELTVVYTTDGAAIPATVPGSWGAVRPAGRP